MPRAELQAHFIEAQRPTEPTRAEAAPRATPGCPVAPDEVQPLPAAEVPPAVPTGPPPAPAVPGVTSGLAPAYGAQPMQRLPAAVQATPVVQGAAMAGPPDISELLAQALEEYRREAAGGEQAEPAAAGRDIVVGELIARALAASRQRGVVRTTDVAEEAGEAAEERGELCQPREMDAGRTRAEKSVERVQEGAMDQGAVAPCGGRVGVEGVEEWMWEWRQWRTVAPGDPCPAGMVFRMGLAAGTHRPGYRTTCGQS